MRVRIVPSQFILLSRNIEYWLTLHTIIETVITCFPKPWTKDHHNADVVKRLKYYFRSREREAITSVYDIVVLILQFCTDILLKANAEAGTAFIDYFEDSIAEAVSYLPLFRRYEQNTDNIYRHSMNPSCSKHSAATSKPSEKAKADASARIKTTPPKRFGTHSTSAKRRSFFES